MIGSLRVVLDQMPGVRGSFSVSDLSRRAAQFVLREGAESYR